MELKIAYHKLPKRFSIELDFDWENETQSLYQGWVPSVRKDFAKISKEIDKKIKSFFIDNKIMPHTDINFVFFAYNTYWQFGIVYVLIESSEESEQDAEINFCKISAQVRCYCADIKEEYKKEIIPSKLLSKEK